MTTNQKLILVEKERLYNDVQKLTSIRPFRNYKNQDSLHIAAEYILKEFQSLDCKTETQTFLAKHPKYLPEGAYYKNIIASFGKETAPRIVIGAHYDVDGDQPGADDNASAVAGLLETARLFHKYKPELRHRVDFVAYCLEEAPFFYTDYMGSSIHASSLQAKNIDLKAMICLEMIGYFSDEPNSQKYPVPQLSDIYPDTANFIALVGKEGQESLVKDMEKWMKQSAGIDIQYICAPVELVYDITRSDHYNYWKKGYKAVMVTDTSFLRNPNYHTPGDTIDTLNFDKMAEVVKGVYWASVNL